MRSGMTTGITLLCLLLVLTAGICHAVPNRIGFQGQLMEDGANLTGFRTVTFSLWSSDAGGEPAVALWHESQAVEVVDGVYQVHLGDGTPLPAGLYLIPQLFLQVDVLHPSLGSQRLAPLMPVTSAMFALQAAHADDADTLEGNTLADLDAAYVLRGESGAVTSTMIADDSIGTDALAENSVGTSEIGNGAVTAADLATNSVTASKIAAGAVGSSEIADGSVTAADLADDYVNVTGDAMTGSLVVGGILSVGANAGNDDDYMQMDAGNEYLQWDDSETRFQLSDALNVEGALAVGYRTTQPVYSVIGYGTPTSGVVSNINDLLVTDDLEVDGYVFGDNITSNGYLRVFGTLYVGTDVADNDDYIRMDDANEYLRWEDDLDDDSGNGLDGGFYFSDEIVANGDIASLADVTATGDVVITGTTGEFKYDSPRTRRLNLPACAFVKDDAYPNAVWDMTSSYAYTSTVGTSGYCYAYAPVYLPEGATVTGVQVQYYDDDASEDVSVTFALRRVSITSISAQNLAYYAMTSSGASTALRVAEEPDAIAYSSIDGNYNYSMYLFWSPTGLTSNLRFYGASITYTVDTVGY